MTTLTNGTEKQIAWATKMREQHIRNTHAVIAHLDTESRTEGFFSEADIDYTIHCLSVNLAAFEQITDAKAIIDMKDSLFQRFDGTWSNEASRNEASNAAHMWSRFLPNSDDDIDAKLQNLEASRAKKQEALDTTTLRSAQPRKIMQDEIDRVQRYIDGAMWYAENVK